MTDRRVIDRLNEIAALYDELAAGQDRPIVTNRAPSRRHLALKHSPQETGGLNPVPSRAESHVNL